MVWKNYMMYSFKVLFLFFLKQFLLGFGILKTFFF